MNRPSGGDPGLAIAARTRATAPGGTRPGRRGENRSKPRRLGVEIVTVARTQAGQSDGPDTPTRPTR